MAEYYPYIKMLHVICAVLSIFLFSLRSAWTFQGSPMLATAWARTIPHFVDTTLFVAAIMLTLIIHQYPFQAPWLTAKVVALLAHILFGLLFFHYRGGWAVRKAALALSLLAFAYIVAVALTKNPLVFG